MYQIKGFNNEFVVDDQGPRTVERAVFEYPLVFGFQFGTNIFQLQLPDGRIIIHHNSSFTRIEATPVEGAPEGFEVAASPVVQ
jgi:hypothetical protein